tara:strand:+ start:239 stop:481 length:243 start_codon:yes stop_codon:yes gene_type:complete
MVKRNIVSEMAEDLLNLHYSQQAKLRKGTIFGGWHEDNIEALISKAIWREGNDSITLKINKDSDDNHISVEILDIQKPNK